MNKIKYTLLLVAFLDVLGLSIFMPLTPELADYFRVSAYRISFAISLYAFFSFISASVLWQLSDRFGRKHILMLCIFGTFLSNLMMCFTAIFWFFLFSRVINGVTGGNISVLQSIFSDVSTTKEERTHNLGLLGAIYGTAFIVGPIIGSLLLNFGIKAPFIVMTGLATLETYIVFFFLKETNMHRIAKSISINPFGSLWKFFNQPRVNLILSSFFIAVLSFSVYQWMLPVFLHTEFGLGGNLVGYIIWGIGLVITINQAILLKRFRMHFFQLKHLFLLVNIGVFALFCLLAFLTSLPAFLWVFYFMIPIAWLASAIYSSEIVEATHESERGEIMGVLGSFQSIGMIAWPLIAGILIDRDISIFVGCAGILFFNLLYIAKVYKLIK